MPYTVPAKTERNNLILKLHEDGKSYNEIGRQFDITSQRVHQIVKRAKLEKAVKEHAEEGLKEVINSTKDKML